MIMSLGAVDDVEGTVLVISLIPTALIVGFFQRQLVSGLTMGGQGLTPARVRDSP